jgi:alcohol dehydrogenase class IV
LAYQLKIGSVGEQVFDPLPMGLGMPQRLRDLEVPWEDFPAIARLTLQDGACPNNPVPVNSPSGEERFH